MSEESPALKQDYGQEYSVGLGIPALEEYFGLDNANIYEFYLIEDVYSYMLTGKLVFNDTRGIFEYGSFVNDADVNVVFGEEENVSTTLKAYKVNRIIPSGPNESGITNTVEILLVDTLFYYLTFQKYSKSGKNTKISTIVEEILTYMLNIFDSKFIEETNEKIDFTMPYWTTLQALNGLSQRASSGSPKKGGYCCYSSINLNSTHGGVILNFQTLEGMLQQRNLLEDTNEGRYVFNTEDQYNYNRILTYDISGVDGFSHKELRGGHRLGYDFNRKKLIDESFTYSSQNKDGAADKFTMLGSGTLFGSTEYSTLNDSQVGIIGTGETKENIIENIYYNNGIKRYCMQNILNITVRGHEYRRPGRLIEIHGPSLSESDVFNRNGSGLYLIKSVIHYFSSRGKPTYRQKLVLIRNAYDFDDVSERYLYPSTKKNKFSNLISFAGGD